MTYVHPEFDFSKREALRAARQQAVDNNHSEFEFGGHVYDVNYARYLLQYLDDRLGKPTSLRDTLANAIKEHGGLWQIDSDDWERLKDLVQTIENIRQRR